MKLKTDKSLRSIAALVLVIGILGCQPGFTVSLASSKETLPNVGFVVDDSEHPKSPQYNSVKVLDADGEIIWRLRTEPSTNAKGVESFAYGDSLDGFTTVVEAKELQPGGNYTLIVSGTGSGQLRFEIDEDGVAVKSAK